MSTIAGLFLIIAGSFLQQTASHSG
jgi:hypothetical protein